MAHHRHTHPWFPGSPEGLLQPGSRVIKTWNSPVLPTDDPEDEEFTAVGVVLERLPDDKAGQRWLCWFDNPNIQQDTGFEPDLLLTDRTSRAHLAWWIVEAPLPPCADEERELWMATVAHPDYMEHAFCHEVGTRGQILDAVRNAREGAEMTPGQIDMLIKVGRHIAGLEPR